MAAKKKDTGYQVAVIGAKGILKILLYVLLVLAMVYLARTAYSFGYAIFNQEPMAEEPGQSITVVVDEGESTLDVAHMLQQKGLVESRWIFWVQERFSDFHGEIKPGTYILNTSQTPEQMLEILAGENTEGQPRDNDEDEAVSKVE